MKRVLVLTDIIVPERLTYRPKNPDRNDYNRQKLGSERLTYRQQLPSKTHKGALLVGQSWLEKERATDRNDHLTAKKVDRNDFLGQV